MHQSFAHAPLVIVVLLTLVACTPEPPDPEPTPEGRGVVLITLDGWSEGPDGGLPVVGEAWTHHDDVVTPSPWVRPAIASMFTGRPPREHGVVHDRTSRLSDGLPTVAERLRDAGWSTAAFIAHPVLARSSGLDRGFQVYDDREFWMFGPMRYHPPVRAAEEVEENFGSWLDSRGVNEPWFAWVHLSGLAPVPPERTDDTGAGQDLGAAIQAIVDRAERETPTVDVVIATARGPAGRGFEIDDAYRLTPQRVRAPLAVRGANLESTGTPAPGTPMAIASRILDAAGAPRMGFESPDPEVRCSWNWAAAIEFGGPVEAACIGAGRFVAREAGQPAREASWAGVVGDDPSSVFAGLDLPEQYRPPADGSLTPEVVARVEEAGFKVPRKPAPREGVSSEARFESRREVMRARLALSLRRDPSAAFQHYRKATELDPSNLAAMIERTETAALVGRHRRGLDAVQEAIDLAPDRFEAWHAAGHAAYAAQEYGVAEAAFLAALDLRPWEADVLYDVACMRALQDDFDEAIAYLRRAWEGGFRQVDLIQADPDLRGLRADGRFDRLMQELVQ